MAGALIAFGLCVACLSYIGYHFEPALVAQGLFFAWLGALFPDIDTKSQGQKLLYAALFVVIMILFVFKKYMLSAVLALFAFFPLFTNHRGLTHSLLFITLLTFAATAGCVLQFPACSTAAVRNGIFFLVGAFSHLLLDFGPRGLLKRARK